MCTISISNDGPGIEPDELSKIFERFYRIEKSRSSATTQPGYGLGLSLAKTIVDIHDGTIQATSTPGVSTTFTIELPHIHKNR